MECRQCKKSCVKAGFQKNGTQKYWCKPCNKYQQRSYQTPAFYPDNTLNTRIVALLREGISMRGMARFLGVTLKTVIERVKRISQQIKRPVSICRDRIYEIDELWTFVGHKRNEAWVMYAMDRKSKEVIDLKVGARTKDNVKSITDTTVALTPRAVCTDGMRVYQQFIPKNIHRIGLPHTRHIERNNLNLRTHLKRLSRKTICFSRSIEILEACLKIYFWGRQTSYYGADY
jgi:insertion element IS1 protein InsB